MALLAGAQTHCAVSDSDTSSSSVMERGGSSVERSLEPAPDASGEVDLQVASRSSRRGAVETLSMAPSAGDTPAASDSDTSSSSSVTDRGGASVERSLEPAPASGEVDLQLAENTSRNVGSLDSASAVAGTVTGPGVLVLRSQSAHPLDPLAIATVRAAGATPELARGGGGRTPQEVWEASFSPGELLPWSPGGLSCMSMSKNELCNVCLEDMRGQVVRVLVCGHLFHFDCIVIWLKVNKSCPICRAVI